MNNNTLTLRNCHCGGSVRIIEPDEKQQFDRIIFCDSCSGVWCLALQATAEKLILAWNKEEKC